MIFVVTSRADLTADWLILELDRRGTPYVRFNTEDYPAAAGIAWTDEGEARIRVRDADVDLRMVTAIWYRRPVATAVAASDPRMAEWLTAEAQAALAGVWHAYEGLWVNHPACNRRAASKPAQLRAARMLALDVPATLVSNDPRRLLRFAATRDRGAVCKPLTHGVVIDDGRAGQSILWTRALDAGDVAALADAGPEPYLVQELVAKACDVRVTVIGDTVFAVRIESQRHAATAVDWRRGDVQHLIHEVEDLPDEVAEACRALVHGYGLSFGAIDLARRPDGGYTFFELNPNGQWAWLEQRTGLPMRARLADLLEAGT